MSRKDDFNHACKRLTDADHRLGVLTSQMKQARERAIECVSKARNAARTLPVDSDITEHAAAAAARARDAATTEGERVYWAELYAKTAAGVGAARDTVAAAERDLVRIEDDFWRDRFAESCAAFFHRNRADLRDMFGAFARMRRDSHPDLGDFFDAVLEHGPQDPGELRLASSDREGAGAAGARAAGRIGRDTDARAAQADDRGKRAVAGVLQQGHRRVGARNR